MFFSQGGERRRLAEEFATPGGEGCRYGGGEESPLGGSPSQNSHFSRTYGRGRRQREGETAAGERSQKVQPTENLKITRVEGNLESSASR